MSNMFLCSSECCLGNLVAPLLVRLSGLCQEVTVVSEFSQQSPPWWRNPTFALGGRRKDGSALQGTVAAALKEFCDYFLPVVIQAAAFFTHPFWSLVKGQAPLS
uniref:Uncharacterized protein n=1 Tax=Sphaerodactylus townsendi TaxID=933632 RepID=A0ACB8FYK7_9SAUR